MKKSVFKFLILSVLVATAPIAQGVPLAGLQEVSSYRLTVLGYLKIFSASLYSDASSASLEFPSESEVALKFVYHRNIDRKELVNRGITALEKQFDQSTMERFAAALQKINDSYQDISKNDSYVLRFTPNLGLSLFFNENRVINIPDDDFARFYLSIWLGKSTPNQSIRKSLIPSSK
ncbi:MAG: chalcone isomerase family protein [Verrucomicrobiota bacterium]